MRLRSAMRFQSSNFSLLTSARRPDGSGFRTEPRSALNFRSGFRGRPRALTMVELLVVMIVIAILAAAVLTGGAGLIGKSRINNTQAVLQVIADAVEQFQRDQTSKPTISSATQQRQGAPPGTTVKYLERYGRYPPDELEVFTARGLPEAATASARSLAPGAAVIQTGVSSPWPAMRYFNDATPADAIEYRDQSAMIVAIETLSESASAILDRLPDRNRTPGPLDAGNPAIFLDRPGGQVGQWDAGDFQIRFIVDDWGNPISYLSERDYKDDASAILSSNHPVWNEAATELIRLNGGVPVLFSYGADGKDQLTADAMQADAKASLVGDFEEDAGGRHHAIDNPLNDDNVYANPALREKLAKGIGP